MNQRIIALKKAAGIDDNPDQEGLDLFAELIVRECAVVALNTGCGDIEDELLEHFGVE